MIYMKEMIIIKKKPFTLKNRCAKITRKRTNSSKYVVGGSMMTEKIICDKDLIKKIVGKDAKTLVIQYDKKTKRAFYKTDTMPRRLPIHISRVKDL